jgi:hypothetical protein
MMNSLFKYVILLGASFVILAAPTCEGDMDPADARRDHIYRLEAVSEVFTSESLSADNLEAFEFRAVEKLMDYADYLGILCSEGYEPSFRQQAAQNIEALFDKHENPDAAMIPDTIDGSHGTYLILIDAVDIIRPLERETDTRYSGSMRYTETILGAGLEDTTLISHSRNRIGIILQMDYKEFGEHSLLVWEVLLGGISPE